MHFTTRKSLATRSAAVLVACALGAATVANAAESKGKKTEEQQIQALQQQLQAVQAQLKQLADQNQALIQHQQQIEQQLSQQQVALQKAQSAAAPGQVQSASGAPGNASALPGNASALPGNAAALPGQPSVPQSASTSSSGIPAANNPLPGAQPGGFGVGALDNLRLWGYGEIYYSRPSRDTSRTTADLARAVFGIGYRFDNRTEFNSEYEVEHGVTSASAPG